MKLTLHQPPEGYESEAEYRCAELGEYCLDQNLGIMICQFDYSTVPRIVLTPKRWRADQGGTYFIVTSFGVIFTSTDHYMLEDNRYYEIGNYFRTEEDALPYKRKWAELFLP